MPTEPAGPLSPVAQDALSAPELVRVGNRLLLSGDRTAAERLYRRALAIDPGLAAAFDGIGRLYLAQKRTDAALQAFARALAQDPTLHSARLGVAEALLAKDRPDDALAQLDAYDGERTAHYYRIVGLALTLDGRSAAAKDRLAEGLARHPNAAGPTEALAVALATDGAYGGAIELLQRLVNDPGPGLDRHRLRLADIYALSGEPQTAFDLTRAALGPDYAATQAAFHRRLARVAPRDRARALILRRLPAEAFAPVPQPEDAAPQPEPDPPAPEAPAAPADTQAPDARVGGYRLQLGAFADRQDAQGHWAKLAPVVRAHAGTGWPAGTQPVPQRGLTRLLVPVPGGYQAASDACQAVQAAGHACLVVPARGSVEMF